MYTHALHLCCLALGDIKHKVPTYFASRTHLQQCFGVACFIRC